MQKLHQAPLKSNIWKMYLFQSLSRGSLAFPLPVIVLFWQDNGLSLTQIMVLQSIFALILVILEVPSGYFADLFGRKTAIVYASIAIVLALIIYSVSSAFSQFIMAELLFAIGLSLLSGADSALLYDTLADLDQTPTYQKVWGNAFFYSLIVMAAANIAGGMIGKMNLRYTWYPALAFACLSVGVTFSFQEPERHKRLVKKDHVHALRQIISYAVIENKKLRWLIVYAGIVLTFTQTVLWFYQPYFQLTGLDIAYFGLVFATFNLISAVSSKYAHRLEGWLGQKYSMLALIPVLGTSYFLMSNLIFQFSFIFAFLQQFVRGFSRVVFTDYVNQQTTSEMRATVLSIQSLAGRLMYAAIIPGVGWIGDQYGLRPGLTIVGIVTFIVGGTILAVLQKARVL